LGTVHIFLKKRITEVGPGVVMHASYPSYLEV
jgi:hypothetical protein